MNLLRKFSKSNASVASQDGRESVLSDSTTLVNPVSTFAMSKKHQITGTTSINIKPVSDFPIAKHRITINKGLPFLTTRQDNTSRKALGIYDTTSTKIAVLDRITHQLYYSCFTLHNLKGDVVATVTGEPRAKAAETYHDAHAADLQAEMTFKNIDDGNKWSKLVIHAKSLTDEETVATLGADEPIVARFSRAPTYDKPFTVTCNGGADIFVVAVAALATAHMAQEARVNFAPDQEAKREAVWRKHAENTASRDVRRDFRGSPAHVSGSAMGGLATLG